MHILSPRVLLLHTWLILTVFHPLSVMWLYTLWLHDLPRPFLTFSQHVNYKHCHHMLIWLPYIDTIYIFINRMTDSVHDSKSSTSPYIWRFIPRIITMNCKCMALNPWCKVVQCQNNYVLKWRYILVKWRLLTDFRKKVTSSLMK